MRGSLSSAGSETLVVPLSGGSACATDAVRRLVGPSEPVVLSLAQVADGGIRVMRGRRYDRLALVGCPPPDEIGYGLAALIALLARPRQVSLVDAELGTVVSVPLLRYLAHAAPFAVGQLTASAIAIGVQRVAIPLARRPSRFQALAPELTRLAYLRPAVGSGSTVGGSVTHAHEVIRALRTEGIGIEAFTADRKIAETAAKEPIPPCRWSVIRIPRATKALPASVAAAGDAMLARAALGAARTADAIYQRHARFSLVGALLAHMSGRPLFLEYNGSEAFKARYWNATPLSRQLVACERAILTAAARIFVVSDVDRRSLLERGVESERIVVNPNGVNPERFAVGGGSEIRRRHGLEANLVVVGFVGTFGPWHGAPLLARAFADIAARLPEVHLLLVGDGPELQPALSILRDAAVDARVTVKGYVSPSDVPGYLDACDILVSPHVPLPDGVDFFGSPTKLYEYMAAGKAIVASRLGQIGDVLNHGVTAWLVEPGDPGSLAKGLSALAETPELRRELGANARQQAIDRHSWQVNARRVIEAYAALAAERR